MTIEPDVIDVHSDALLDVTPVVSVHMLAYRHGRYIRQAIDGVLSQTGDIPLELIIAEDCSPDDTLEVALAYQRQHPGVVRVITGRTNVGMHQNSRRSLPYCRGRYIAFCEGDDYWHCPNKLEKQVALMNAAEDMVFCHTDYDRLTRLRTRRNVHKRKRGRFLPAQGHAYESLLFTWSVMTATSMFRRDVVFDFMRSRYYVHKWPFGDLTLLLFASLRGRVGYIDESTATFRKMMGSAGNRGFDAALQMQLAAEECVNLFLEDFPASEQELVHIIAARKQSIYSQAYLANRMDLFEESFEWLQSNGFRPSRLRHLAITLAHRTRLPLLALKYAKAAVWRLSAFPA